MSARPLPLDDLAAITRDAARDLRSLEGGHLLITGASGMFGRWLLASFAHANAALGLRARCTGVARRARALLDVEPILSSDSSITIVDGDVRTWAPDPRDVPTHVVHAATSTSGSVAASETLATIVDGTRNVLAHARHDARLLYVSSGAVYGTQPTTIDHVDEKYFGGPDPLEVRTTYGEAKRLAEQCCAIAVAERGLAISIARGFAFSGPLLPLDAHFAFGNFIGDAIAKRTIVVQGDGTPRRSYLYASDLTRWLWALLARGPSGRAFNVGSDRSVSIAELAREIGRIGGVDVEIRGTPTPGVAPARYVPSIDRARRELGLDVKIDLATSIEKTLAWHAR